MDSLNHKVGQDWFVMLYCVGLVELCETVVLSKIQIDVKVILAHCSINVDI